MEKSFIILFFSFVHTQAFHSVFRIDLSEITVLLYMIFYLIKMFTKNETAVVTISQMLNIILCCFILISSVNVIGGIFGLVLALARISLFILIPFLFINYIYKKDLLVFTLKWFVIFTVISSVIAILQEIIFLYTDILLIGFIDHRQLKFMTEWTSYGLFLRVPAFFGFHYPFAYYLVISGIILFNYSLYKIQLTRKEKICFLIGFLLIVVALVLTFCHDALGLFALCLIVSVFIRWPAKSFHLMTSMMIIFLIMFILGLFNGIVNEFITGVTIRETRIRVQLAREGIEGFFRHPWIGVGFERSGIYTSHYHQWPPHSAFIQAADEIGILGFLAYCSLIIYVFMRILQLNFIVREYNEMTGMIRALLLGYIIYIMAIQFQPMAFTNFLWIYIGIIEGTVLLLSNSRYETKRVISQGNVEFG